jgi:hypothetical protein
MEDNNDKHDAAYEAMCKAVDVAADVAGLMDRHWGDSGTDPAMILQPPTKETRPCVFW